MKRRYPILIGIAALCVIAIILLFRKQPTPPLQEKQLVAASQPASPQAPLSSPTASPTPPHPDPSPANQETQEEKWGKVFSHVVNFYGKAVDEDGRPIERAAVRYSVPSNLLEIGEGTVEGPLTDVNGLFSITGKMGAGITVVVSHPDYYSTDLSGRQFSYFESTDQNPTASNPAVFVLRKKGTAEPLLKLKQVLRNLPKNGQVVGVGLISERAGDVTIQAWTSPRPAGAPNNAPFAWKVRVEVPGGGLVAYEEQSPFEAPEDGYLPSVEFTMPESGIDGRWRDRFEQSYFVKLANGNYARMDFRMIAGGAHFAVVESFYNPSGSRNLEYDASNAISPNP